VKVIEVKPNDVFDPNLHEAISHDDAEDIESGHVIEMLQTGYKIGERVVRPALVRVAR
jgi:molecular chaperone GrpE